MTSRNKKMFNLLTSLFAGGCLLAANAAPASIGTIKSPGEFRVDGSLVRGNGNVFDGDEIETAAARSVVELSGLQITMSPQSRAKFYRDRAVLESGTTMVRDSGNHTIEAATLRIVPGSKDSLVQIETSGPNHVWVSTRNGPADVRTAGGILVASLHSGMALAFDPQASASAAARIAGMLRIKGEKVFLKDETTNVTVELRGSDLAKYDGKDVLVTGSIIGGAAPADGASEVIQVIAIDTTSKKKAAAVLTGSGAGVAGTGAASAGAASVGAATVGAATAGAAAGISTATTAAVVAGVGVAGSMGGLAAAGSFSGSSTVSPQ